MSEDREDQTGTLSTKVEDAFISPLTAIRGVLEILRDFPDLSDTERSGFVSSALVECARLEAGIDHLADAVYGLRPGSENSTEPEPDQFSDRIRFSEAEELIDVGLNDLVFDSTATVNAFFDVLDRSVNRTGRKWYIIVDHTNCRIWPEAWVAFAHRTKKVNVNFSLGTVKLDADIGDSDPGYVATREAALEKIAVWRQRPSWERA